MSQLFAPGGQSIGVSALTGSASNKESACLCRRHQRPQVGKIPWRRAWQSTPVLLPGESHGLLHTRLPCPSSSWTLLKLMSFESVMPSNRLILCCPLLLLLSIFHRIRVFLKESVLGTRWPKYWSFSFSISPSNEYSGLISFRIDWFDLLVVQGTLNSLFQHHR